MGVAEAAVAARGQDDASAPGAIRSASSGLAVLGEDLGADRQAQVEVGAARAGAVLAHAVLAARAP